MESRTFTVGPEHEGMRIDTWLACESELSRSRIRRLIDGELVTSPDGSVPKPSHPVELGEAFTVTEPPQHAPSFGPEDIPLDIVYQDDHLAVVNKQSGMVVHPGRGNTRGTLAAGLLHHFGHLSTVGGAFRPGIVHRLDKDTSGLLVVALDDTVHRQLSAILQDRKIHRRYTAYVWGHPRENEGVIDAPIGRHKRIPTRKAVVADGRDAVTRYAVERSYEFLSRLSIELHTGRTHQIRVHLAHIGHHVFGDHDYGGRDDRLGGFSHEVRLTARRLLRMLDRQALHASMLSFVHPVTGEECVFEAPLPDDLAELDRVLESE
jgi:23S rRNA pseudouridine1911/1915/1917 synthase